MLPGPEQSSYRSEMGGLLGMASAIQSVLLPPDTPPIHIPTLCDDLLALHKSISTKHRIKSNMKDAA